MSLRDHSSDPLELLRRAEDVVPAPGAEERVAALLLSGASGAAVGIGALSSSGAELGAGMARRLLRRFAAWSLAPLAAGIVIGARGQALLNSQRDRAVVAATTKVVSTEGSPAPRVSADAAPAPLSVDSSAARGAGAAAPAGSAVPAARVSARSRLAEERAILDRARQKLAADEPERALQFLEEHARRYPSGTLSEEREAMFVNVLVSLGRSEEAESRGGSFQKRFPNSLMLSSVKAALAANANH